MNRAARVGRFCTHAAPRHSFITTPIFYVNAAPHIGHLYSAVLADASHRWQKMKGAEPAAFSTGTDEHGLKIQKSAAALNCSPMELCNRVSLKFKELFDLANIGYTDYIRTTETRHREKVEWLWDRLFDRGYLYKSTYEGWYSVPDETFLSPSQVIDGPDPQTKVSKETGHLLEWSSEENYLFKLTALRERLLQWIDSEPHPIIPEVSRQLVQQWVAHETTSDLSVSRPRTRLTWGIPVPNDSSQTMYVWLDALTNYLTVSGYPSPAHFWPATAHIVGKDILRFHAVYWPAFLMAVGVEPPRRIVSHAHWTVGRSKMSKSKGNVVDPLDQISKFGVDPLRYFLLKEGNLNQDGNYSEERVARLLNTDLADTMGNLLQRITATKLNPQGPKVKFSTDLFSLGDRERSPINSVRTTDEDYALVNNLIALPGIVDKHYENFEFNRGITAVMGCLHQTNQFIDRHKPWELVLDSAQHSWLQTVLSVAVESLRLCSCLLHPIIPQSSEAALQRLGFDRDSNSTAATASSLGCLLRSEETVMRLEHGQLELGGNPLFRKV